MVSFTWTDHRLGLPVSQAATALDFLHLAFNFSLYLADGGSEHKPDNRIYLGVQLAVAAALTLYYIIVFYCCNDYEELILGSFDVVRNFWFVQKVAVFFLAGTYGQAATWMLAVDLPMVLLFEAEARER